MPELMADRWAKREMLPPGQGRIYWHILLEDHPEVRAMASTAHERLAGIPGLDLTPHRWLHLTVLIAGLTNEISDEQMTAMVTEAGKLLAQVRPVTATLGRVLYHPEAVMLEARPAAALAPILEAAQTATRTALGRDGIPAHEPWTPHVTLAYSKAAQPAAPIIAALGRQLPTCEVTVGSIDLVVQDGPEYLWDWRPVAKVPIGSPS
ncbi:2'-5' RNA ligase family protein [Sphaerimonospora thailandensis]|nr:2'-5' RNA ligase family protein [Sphaerimonospora thailandensis]